MAAEGRGRGELGLFLLGNVLFAAGLFIHAFSFNFYLRELGYSAVVMGTQVTAMTLGGLLALLPTGYVIDRFGTRTAMLAGVAATTAGLVVTALVRDRTTILAAAALVGVGGVGCRVSWGPAIMRLTDESRRARAFSWNVAVLIGSGAIWTLLAGVIPERAGAVAGLWGLSGTQLVLLGGGVVTGLAAFCYWPLHLPSAAAEPTAIRIPTLPKEVRFVIPCVALWMLSAALVLPFFNVYFADRFAMSVRWIGALFAVAHVGTAIVLIGAAEAARRWTPQRTLAWWVAAFAPSLWWLAAAGTAGLAVTLYVLQGIMPPAINPLIDQLVLERVDKSRHGAVAAWRNAAAEASGAVGATAGGYILAAMSFSGLFLIAGIVAAACGILLVAVLRSRPRTMEPASIVEVA